MRRFLPLSLAALISVAAVAGCSNIPGKVDEDEVLSREDRSLRASGSVVGDGLTFGGSRKRESDTGGALGVNSFLWRATLDTIAFLPLASADPFGGVIITDWHSPAGADERFKMNVYVLGRALRADGVRVSVFRQVRGQDGAWRDAPVPETTGSKVEDAILTKARQLRNDSLAAN